jgi:hypothetical protein
MYLFRVEIMINLLLLKMKANVENIKQVNHVNLKYVVNHVNVKVEHIFILNYVRVEIIVRQIFILMLNIQRIIGIHLLIMNMIYGYVKHVNIHFFWFFKIKFSSF